MNNNQLSNSDTTKETRTRRPSLTPELGHKVGRFKDRLKLITDGESLRGFGRKAGISEGALRHYLNGDSFPDLDRLAAIAEEANVNLLWLATGEGLMRGESVVSSMPCSVDMKMDALVRALALVESVKPDAPLEQKAKAVAMAYALIANEGRPLDADAIRQVVESLVK